MSDEPRRGVFNISSDPDTTSIQHPESASAREVPQLPLRLLLVSDLTPNATDVDWSGPSRVHRVDKTSFAALMKEGAPRLTLEVPNKISDTPKTLDLDLGFADLEAFHPVQVIAQVPPLAQLLHIRTLVAGVRSSDLTPDAFRERLGETGVDADWADQLYETLSRPPEEKPKSPPKASPASSSSEGSDTLDRLLGMVAAGVEETEPAEEKVVSDDADAGPSSLVGALMEAVAGASEAMPKVEKSAADLLLADLDDILSAQLNAIVNAPAFRRLEGAWRGLKFLVDRLNFRKNIQLDVLAVPKHELDDALYHQVLLPEHESEGERPALSAVILDYAFDRSAEDLQHLNELAETGASLQVPLVGAVGSAFFGLAQDAGLAQLPVVWQHLDAPEYIAWHKLREQEEARFLALALPAFLLRPAYGSDAPVEAFSFAEEGYLWGNASLAVAVRIADSFAATGWPTHLEGGLERLVEDLPVREGSNGATPLAALLPDGKFGELKKAGFTVLGGKRNKDTLCLARAVTVGKPESYEDLMAAAEAREHVTLAAQLFVARAAHYVLFLQRTMTPLDSVEAMKQELEARLRAFLYTAGQTVPPDAVIVQHVQDVDLPEHELFGLRLNAPSFILDRPVSLVLGVQVPKAASA